jgi:exosortase K
MLSARLKVFSILNNREFSLGAMLAAISAALGIKAFYSHSGADELLWVLGPSAWLAKFAGGIDLVYERGAGYISHTHHLVVGPSCAGVNFLVICFLCLYFSFARHFDSKARWLFLSAIIAFTGTVGANGLRIFVSAHLWDASFYRPWMSAEEMHRVAGVTIYYASLLALYLAVQSRIGTAAPRSAPLLWYIGISLGVPLAGRIYAGGGGDFAGHAAWVLAVVILLTFVKALPATLRNRINCRS